MGSFLTVVLQVPVPRRTIQHSYLRHGPQCHPIDCEAALAPLISTRSYIEKSMGSVCRILRREVRNLLGRMLLCNDKEAAPYPEETGDDCDSKRSQKGKGSRVEFLRDYGFLV